MFQRVTRVVLIAILAAATQASAQDLVITTARVVIGNGAVVPNGAVVVRGGKIVSAGPTSPGARRGSGSMRAA